MPVVPTVAISGEGIKKLVSRIKDAKKVKIKDIARRAYREEVNP